MSEELDPVLRLVEQFQAGVDPEESFRGIFQLYHSRVEAFFRRKGFSEEEGRDLTQETFLQVFRALPSFRHRSSFLVWLFAIMDLVYKNRLRWRKADKRDGVEVSIDTGPDERPRIELATEDGDPLSRSISRERFQELRAALEGLPEQMRLCCLLRYERGCTYHEIALLMGISINTVKSHLHQARQRLIAKLGDAGLS
jgi:RNA polymerase sigma-70 factor (ECF subfamily)